MENYIAIGDIHGRFDLLTGLLKKIDESPYKDFRLVFLGDLIDRGPQVFEVVQKVKELNEQRNAIVLLGNHDHWAVEYHRKRIFDKQHPWIYYPQNGGRKTVEQYCKKMGLYGMGQFFVAFERSGHAAWFRSLPFYYETDKVWFSHSPVPKTRGYREGDYRASPTDLMWTRIRPEEEGLVEMDHGKTAVAGHNHRIEQEIWTPRFYNHIIHVDTGAGCDHYDRAPLSGVIIEDGKATGEYLQAFPEKNAQSTKVEG